MKFNEINFNNISATEYKKNLLIKYGDDKDFLHVQTEWLQLTQYGVPREDKFHTTEKQRQYIQLPLNDEAFSNFIKELDKYFSSDKFKQKYLTTKQQSYSYTPIYKEGNEKYPPSIKIKMLVDDKDNILTEFFHVVDDNNVKKYVINMDNVKDVFPYMCEYRIIFKVSKIWFMSNNYGVKLQLTKAQIKPTTKPTIDVDFV
jgi:hypothetical protein